MMTILSNPISIQAPVSKPTKQIKKLAIPHDDSRHFCNDTIPQREMIQLRQSAGQRKNCVCKVVEATMGFNVRSHTLLETLQPSQILTDRMNERFGNKKWRHLLDHTPNPSKKKTHFRLLTRNSSVQIRGSEAKKPASAPQFLNPKSPT